MNLFFSFTRVSWRRSHRCPEFIPHRRLAGLAFQFHSNRHTNVPATTTGAPRGHLFKVCSTGPGWSRLSQAEPVYWSQSLQQPRLASRCCRKSRPGRPAGVTTGPGAAVHPERGQPGEAGGSGSSHQSLRTPRRSSRRGFGVDRWHGGRRDRRWSTVTHLGQHLGQEVTEQPERETIGPVRTTSIRTLGRTAQPGLHESVRCATGPPAEGRHFMHMLQRVGHVRSVARPGGCPTTPDSAARSGDPRTPAGTR